jgi:hypothetical protein
MTISHDEFQLLWRIVEHGGTLDCTNVGDKERKLEAEGWINVEKYDTRVRLQASSQLLTLLEALQLTTPINTYTSSSEQPDRRDQVSALVGNVVKHSHAGYVAVVRGRQGRRDPFQEYAKKLSAQNRKDFWLAVMHMTKDEQAQLARDLV